ncbi:MAG: tetratricopeptide (TPR) repeat protein [Planctomycetota bacterium]|jgi:tetratricopeptide (TPR) repeat protein
MLKRSLMVLAAMAGCSQAPAVDPPFGESGSAGASFAPQSRGQGKAERELAALAGFDFEASDLGLAVTSGVERGAAEQELSRALEHQRANEHLHALERFAAAVRLAPEWAPALAGFARGLADMRQEQLALRVFERALALASDDVQLLFDKADLLQRMGQRDAARATFSAVLKNQPAHAPAHGRMARLLFLAGDLQRARKSAQLAMDGGEELPARLKALASSEAPR